MKEKTITNQILKYLKSLPDCFAFKEHGGLYGTSGFPTSLFVTRENSWHLKLRPKKESSQNCRKSPLRRYEMPKAWLLR